MIVEAILGVLLVSAFIGWQAWRLGKRAERMERDPKYRRRWLYFYAVFFGIPAIVLSMDVMRGHAPASRLLGLPIPLGLAWFFIRAARQVESSSKANIPK